MTANDNYQRFELPGRVRWTPNPGGLPSLQVTGGFSTAEIYPHGAHVTRFAKPGEPPLLFLSDHSLFAPDKAIRGGIPICFPWFGARPGAVTHGVARLVEWEWIQATADPAGRVTLGFLLPPARLTEAGWPAARVTLTVGVAEELTLELAVRNETGQDFEFEACLHTYLAVGDIAEVELRGLQGRDYLDKVEQFACRRETAEALRIQSEVDRIYLHPQGTVAVRDARWGRTLTVAKSGSASTVVWNPWQAKARAMADFGAEEYRGMVCVESGNVGADKLTLPPGGAATLRLALASTPGL